MCVGNTNDGTKSDVLATRDLTPTDNFHKTLNAESNYMNFSQELK